MCFLLSCVEVQHSMHFMLHAASFSFCFLDSAALATSLLTKQSWPWAWDLFSVVGVCQCALPYNFEFSQPASSQSVFSKDSGNNESAALPGWWGWSRKRFWLYEWYCVKLSSQTWFICWAIAPEAFFLIYCSWQASSCFFWEVPWEVLQMRCFSLFTFYFLDPGQQLLLSVVPQEVAN